MSKLPHVGTTIFTVMSQLANEYGAINLSQGFPNFEIDQRLKDITAQVAQSGAHQYAPMAGNPALITELEKLIFNAYQKEIDGSSELLITAGATQGIYSIIQAFIEHGDEVVILDPSYDCYDPAIVLAGGKCVHVSLNDQYRPDWEKIESAFSSKTKMIITNNPHNPSGIQWQSSDFNQLEELMQRFPKCLVLSDEVYEFITFENKHQSMHQLESLRNRTFIVSSFGKSFHITGWKVGYMWAPEPLMREVKKVHQFLVFSVNSIAQQALAEYLRESNVSELGKFYQQKRDLFQKGLANSKFKLLPSESTYFQLVSYEGISELSDVDFTKWMTKEIGVASIPVSVFNEDKLDRKHIRFCFAKTDETLTLATEKLCKI